MKQMTKILVAAVIILSVFTMACNKNNRLETAPETISGSVILSWNEITFDTRGESTNQHS